MIEKSIKNKIESHLDPEIFILENESHMHSGPRTESHFKVYIVSNKFEGLSRIERQQLIYKILDEEFKEGMHALSLKLKTPTEHQKNDGSKNFISPECLGKFPAKS